nr:hypothetical protein GCM10025732_36910 [Glycomyces mayteni]
MPDAIQNQLRAARTTTMPAGAAARSDSVPLPRSQVVDAEAIMVSLTAMKTAAPTRRKRVRSGSPSSAPSVE